MTDPVLPPPAQGDPNVTVTRQTAPDIAQRLRAEDPISNLPVAQGDPEITVTRQTGIPLQGGPGGAMQADRPADHLVQRSDAPIPVDHDAGYPGHPGVVPGNPAALNTDPAQPPVPGGEVEVTRTEGSEHHKVDGPVIFADHPLAADHPTGVEMPQVLSAEQLAAAKASSGRVVPSDRPAAPDQPQVILHDPMAALQQMADASVSTPEQQAEVAAKRRGRPSNAEKAAQAAAAQQAQPPVVDVDADANEAAGDASKGDDQPAS